MKNTVKTNQSKRFRSATREIAYIGLAVAVIAVCAWISLPVGPIPFTLQTLSVALVGALLGWKRGTAAVAVYILMGLVGVPVFAGFKSGIPALFGPTGGYIFGFLFAALLPALFKLLPVKKVWARMALFYLGSILGLAVCYFFGTVWFVLMYDCTVGYALVLCVTPYILPDLVKLAVAAFLAARLEKRLIIAR